MHIGKTFVRCRNVSVVEGRGGEGKCVFTMKCCVLRANARVHIPVVLAAQEDTNAECRGTTLLNV
jgi:hypothetical protein